MKILFFKPNDKENLLCFVVITIFCDGDFGGNKWYSRTVCSLYI